MWDELTHWISPEAVKLVITLALSFLLGLEREQHKAQGDRHSLGGIRTFPLLGLCGYSFALLAGNETLPIALGFVSFAALMVISYRHKLSVDEHAGLTTEISALGTYLVGALIARGHVWLATAIVVMSVLLLELKVALEGLPKRIPPNEIAVFARFLLLTAVLLPVVPNRDFTSFKLNPFKTWLVVAAVSSVSYGSYVLQKVARGRGGVLFSGILGGIYSSTITTVALAKQAARSPRTLLYSGAIVAASGVMFLRLGVLLALFNRALLGQLWAPFLALAVLASGSGSLIAWRGEKESAPVEEAHRNPLELRSALLFAVLFVAMSATTRIVASHLGHAGVLVLAAVLGVVDVDPFILGLAQVAGGSTPLGEAAQGIVVASSSNNLAKAGYSLVFGGRTMWRAALGLALLAALGLLPLLWL